MGSVTSLLKRPDGNTPNDYRPITLLPIIFKIYERLLLCEMNWKHKFRDNLHILQCGNRAKRGVPEQIGILNIVAETAQKHNKPLYCAFIDIQKAFDTVWRKGLLYKLHKDFHFPKYLCKLIAAIYNDSKSTLKNAPFVSNIFPLHNGVLQGSVISPLLFAAFIDDMIHEMQNSNACALTPDINELIACIFYADDVVITANSIDNLKILINICEQHSKKWAYKFNEKKCKIMIYNDPNNDSRRLIPMKENEFHNIINEYIFKMGHNNKKIPPLFLLTPIINSKLTGLDLNGYNKEYNTDDIPDDILKDFKKYSSYYNNDIANKPFLIQWINLPFNPTVSESYIHHNIKLNNNSIKITTFMRYLGGQLDHFNPTNIVHNKNQ